MRQVKNKFSVGDMVIVNRGMIDPDFGQEISGWVGTVESLRYLDHTGFMYKVRWSLETLKESSVLRVSCDELGLDFETMQLLDPDISLYSSARAKQFLNNNVPSKMTPYEIAHTYGAYC
ncbi:hypothetical protein L4D09_27100 [Photobacterium makurazakiensis]|uniref:hypothetical protein n=1 Tax=Photobacterium makurazakiensis TaxID=2910234 RepID=UPI003D0F1035